MSQKKKIIGPVEWASIIALLGLLVYMGLRYGDGTLVQKTETVELTDNPSQGGDNAPKRYIDRGKEANVDAILRQIADQYGDDYVVSKNDPILEDAGMSKSEAKFLETVKKQKKKDVDSKQDVDWFSILRTSHKTYKKVKSALEDSGIEFDEVEDKVSTALINEAASRTFYSKLERTFGISEERSKSFAEEGSRAVSDWARFVEENMKQE